MLRKNEIDRVKEHVDFITISKDQQIVIEHKKLAQHHHKVSILFLLLFSTFLTATNTNSVICYPIF